MILTKRFELRITPEDEKKISAIAKQLNCSYSEIIRVAMREKWEAITTASTHQAGQTQAGHN